MDDGEGSRKQQSHFSGRGLGAEGLSFLGGLSTCRRNIAAFFLNLIMFMYSLCKCLKEMEMSSTFHAAFASDVRPARESLFRKFGSKFARTMEPGDPRYMDPDPNILGPYG